MKPGFRTYLGAAFNARPLGMPLPPNWLALAAVGMLGVLNPGFWLIGAGLEVAYLLWLTSNARFRTTVDAAHLDADSGSWQARRAGLLARLTPALRQRQEQLEERCRFVLNQGGDDGALSAQQADNLAQLAWVHLRLLLSRQRLDQVVTEADAPADIAARIAALKTQLAGPVASDTLRASLASQLDILTARAAGHAHARDQLALIDAELERLRQQVELVREQSALASDPAGASRAIDALGATLGETNRWLTDQRQSLGEVDDLTAAPPPAAIFSARPTAAQRS